MFLSISKRLGNHVGLCRYPLKYFGWYIEMVQRKAKSRRKHLTSMFNQEKMRYGMIRLAPFMVCRKMMIELNADEIDVVWKKFCEFIGRHTGRDQKGVLVAWNDLSCDVHWIYK